MKSETDLSDKRFVDYTRICLRMKAGMICKESAGRKCFRRSIIDHASDKVVMLTVGLC